MIALACAVQLLPLAGPVLLWDVYTYWDYARISTEHGGNPYTDVPSDHPDDVAYPLMGSYWHDTTSVYGPGFTLASEAHASTVGESPDAAAWAYRGLAAVAMVALVLLAGDSPPDPPSPLPSSAGTRSSPSTSPEGHNDAWMMAFVLGALALAASGKAWLAGVSWALAITIKWVPLLCPCGSRGEETRRKVDHRGLALGAVVIVAVATWRYGLSWVGAVGPLATNLAEDRARYALPSRVASLGLPEGQWRSCSPWPSSPPTPGFCARPGADGRASRHRRSARCTSWLVPWYAVWAVPLAAVEEDRTARALALALSAYLLRDAVPI